MFRYKIDKKEGRNFIVIHLNRRLHKIDYECVEDSGDFDEAWKHEKMPSFLRHILQINGIEDLSYDMYSIRIEKGEVFCWNELIPQIIANLELDLNGGEKMYPITAKNRYNRRKKSSCKKDLVSANNPA
ncbi:MAG: hypothetical protein WCO10_01865 [bacterium]